MGCELVLNWFLTGFTGLSGLQPLAIQGILDFKGRHSKKVLVNASTFKYVGDETCRLFIGRNKKSKILSSSLVWVSIHLRPQRQAKA